MVFSVEVVGSIIDLSTDKLKELSQIVVGSDCLDTDGFLDLSELLLSEVFFHLTEEVFDEVLDFLGNFFSVYS